MNFIEIFKEYFIEDTIHRDILPTPCIIVEDVIIQKTGFEPGKKAERLREIQHALASYGLKIIQFKHFIDYIREYFPLCSEEVYQKLDKKCKYKQTPILCYMGVECKEGDHHDLTAILNQKLDMLNDFIDDARTVAELYRFHTVLSNLETELFKSRKDLSITNNDTTDNFAVDLATGVIYHRIKTKPVGTMVYIDLPTFLEFTFPDANDIFIEYNLVERLFPVFKIFAYNRRVAPFEYLAVDNLLLNYKQRECDIIEEYGMLAYFSITGSGTGGQKKDYILFKNDNDRVEF